VCLRGYSWKKKSSRWGTRPGRFKSACNGGKLGGREKGGPLPLARELSGTFKKKTQKKKKGKKLGSSSKAKRERGGISFSLPC